jgi:aspartyl-tRNA(Asn)/glutamyl-tRNA(Gln) amidotransferase subunit C
LRFHRALRAKGSREEIDVEVTRDEVLKIAALARLHFNETELEQFTSQFKRILEYVEKLKEVDVEGIPPTSHVSQVSDLEGHIIRQDQVQESLGSEIALANAPDAREGQFRVPKVL